MAPTAPTRKHLDDSAAAKPSKMKSKSKANVETTSRTEKTRSKNGVITGRIEKASKKSSDTNILAANTSDTKASGTKTSVDEDYYDDHPMDKNFRFNQEDLRSPTYRRERTRLAEYFGSIACRLQLARRLRGQQHDLNIINLNLPLLVGDVTGGQYGLMKDLVACKERIKQDGDGEPAWGNARDVESLLEALEKDLDEGTAVVAVDERPKVKKRSKAEERKGERRDRVGVRGPVTRRSIFAPNDAAVLDAALRLSQIDSAGGM